MQWNIIVVKVIKRQNKKSTIKSHNQKKKKAMHLPFLWHDISLFTKLAYEKLDLNPLSETFKWTATCKTSNQINQIKEKS